MRTKSLRRRVMRLPVTTPRRAAAAAGAPLERVAAPRTPCPCACVGALAWQRRQPSFSGRPDVRLVAVEAAAVRRRGGGAPPFAICPGLWHSAHAARVWPSLRVRLVAARRRTSPCGAPWSFIGAWMPWRVWQRRQSCRVGAEPGLVREELVAGEAVERVHLLDARPRARRGTPGTSRRRARTRACSRRGSGRTQSSSPRSGCGARATRPTCGQRGSWEKWQDGAGADLDLRVLAPSASSRRRTPRASRRPGAATSGGSAGRRRSCGSRRAKRELGRGAVAGGAEARVLVHELLEAQEPEHEPRARATAPTARRTVFALPCGGACGAPILAFPGAADEARPKRGRAAQSPRGPSDLPGPPPSPATCRRPASAARTRAGARASCLRP